VCSPFRIVYLDIVIPAKAGIQSQFFLDSRFHGNGIGAYAIRPYGTKSYNGIFLFGTSPYITKWVKPLAVFAHLRWYDMTLAFTFSQSRISDFLALFLGLFKFLHLLPFTI